MKQCKALIEPSMILLFITLSYEPLSIGSVVVERILNCLTLWMKRTKMSTPRDLSKLLLMSTYELLKNTSSYCVIMH